MCGGGGGGGADSQALKVAQLDQGNTLSTVSPYHAKTQDNTFYKMQVETRLAVIVYIELECLNLVFLSPSQVTNYLLYLFILHFFGGL